jgi:hypothetical protein
MRVRAASGIRGITVGLLVMALAAFYYLGATEHARRVNVDRGRADQSGYLWDAVAVHGNWQGNPPVLIGERNRMPIYPGLLALLYEPDLSPDIFFERGKRLNILLSMALLAGMWLVARRFLPPLAAFNFLLVVAFGYFIFKAGYVQCELLFYGLLFGAFVCFARLLTLEPGRTAAVLALAGGVVCGLAHLTKASALPLAGLFSVISTGAALVEFARSSGTAGWKRLAARAVVLSIFAVAFLGTLYPYISNSKRVFGHYFYNVNTTFYIWYDDWPSASLGTYQHGDGVGWPRMPPDQLPSMRRYLREHSVHQIADRLLDGFRDMVVVTYERYWIVKFLALYSGVAVVAAIRRRDAFAALLRDHLPLAVFLLCYAGLYLLAVAFYKPISGTTGRMILAHVAPLVFALSWFLTRPVFAAASLAGPLRVAHLQPVVLALMLLDVAFRIWPQLFATFTGY